MFCMKAMNIRNRKKAGSSFRVAVIMLVTGLLAMCGTVDFAPTQMNDGWKISAPGEQGLSSSQLESAYEYAETLPFLYSALVVRHGFLVAERYFNGSGPHHTEYVASVTKSYLSALIGIAVEQGHIESINRKMMSYFPEYESASLEPDKYDITLRHLLRMRAGYWFDSQDDRWAAWVNSPDWIAYMINLPLENPPGTLWNYSSGSTHILSAVLTKSTGMRAEDFARQYLFGPLDTKLGYWNQDPHGYNYGGWAMYITARDMARFGLLYLNGGNYQGRQIVPEQWVRESTHGYSEVDWTFGRIEEPRYGCLWWSGIMEGHPLFFAQGHGGQNIMVFPGLDMVVVTTTNPDLGFGASWTQSLKTFFFIAVYILPAVS